MRASAMLAPGKFDAAGEVLIDFDARHRRRVVLHTTLGEVLLDLPRAARLRDGDGLLLDDGRVVRVRARAEALLEISGDAAALVRIAWHLGNRHLPVQFTDGVLRIRADHVIADMVKGLGGVVSACDAAFDPEAGAYASAPHAHAHDDHGHAHG